MDIIKVSSQEKSPNQGNKRALVPKKDVCQKSCWTEKRCWTENGVANLSYLIVNYEMRLG